MFAKEFNMTLFAYSNQLSSRNHFGDEPIFWWIQGSEKFCVEIGDKLTGLWRKGDELGVAAPGGSRGGSVRLRRRWCDHPADLEWKTLNHNSVGGSTISMWYLGSSLRLDKVEFFRHDEIKRSIGDYLSSTENGTVVELGYLEQGLIGPTSHIPFSKIDKVNVLAHSVFSKTGWVKRQLSGWEMALICDLPSCFKSYLSRGVGKSKTMPFLYATPERVLRRLAYLSSSKIDSGKRKRQENVDIEAECTSLKRTRASSQLKEELECPPPMEKECLRGIEMKAAKADDAEIDTSQWNIRLFKTLDLYHVYSPKVHGVLLEKLRELFMMNWYRRLLVRSFTRFLRIKYGLRWYTLIRVSAKDSELKRDLKVGRECVERAVGATWWEWNTGSTLMFWRYHPKYQKEARDGTRVFIHGVLPNYTKKQRWSKDINVRNALKKKLAKFRSRKYVVTGEVLSLLNIFDVPKGIADIRLVNDATKSGLNRVVWAPNFFLPTVTSLERTIQPTSWMADADMGEMFLNYPLEEVCQPYVGVDVTDLSDDSVASPKLERWVRALMGFRPSPYICVRGQAWIEEVILGDPKNQSNPFKWTRVVLNIPCTDEYDPTMPWIYKWDDKAEAIAGDATTFVDDARIVGNSEEHCSEVTRRFASLVNYFGSQDATRKRRKPSQTENGPWTGSILEIDGDNVYVRSTQAKWDKIKGIIKGLLEEFELARVPVVLFDHKQLEKDRGFMVHMGMTYDWLKPFYKGVHLTLEDWRGNRRSDGWKYEASEWNELLDNMCHGRNNSESRDLIERKFVKEREKKKSDGVKAAPRLKSDLLALERLTQAKEPPKRLLRGKRILIVRYGFGDASKNGFGSTWKSAKSNDIHFRFGVWDEDDNEGKSSNYRELSNLVETLEELFDLGELEGSQFFLFTDNEVSSDAFYKGNSTSELLFELILRLKILEVNGCMKIYIIHLAGTRMIMQGSDDLSRGCLHGGVMKGEKMESFIPLHLTALDASGSLLGWLESWWHSPLIVLAPKDWFERGHDIIGWSNKEYGVPMPILESGEFLWAPPPAVADAAIEQLRNARLKRQESTHIIVVPKVMKHKWIGQLYKVADIVFELKAGRRSYWPSNTHESLMIGICFPFLIYKPWQLRNSPAFLEVGRVLRQLWKEKGTPERDFLCKFRKCTRELPSMSENVVWKVLQSKRLFKV